MALFGRRMLGGASAGGASGYIIAKSCRFNDDDSANMNLSPSAGTRDLWAFATWLKLCNLGITRYVIGADTSSPDAIFFNSSDQLCVTIAGTARLVSTQKFRDVSSWGHLFVQYDAGNGTDAHKLRVYWNGVEIITWGTDTRSGITTTTAKFGTTAAIRLGRDPTAASSYFDGYMAQTIYRDNFLSTPAVYGTTDSNTGEYVPVNLTGVNLGTRGWLLDYADSSNLGNDVGAGGTDFTPNNFQTNDQSDDTPSDNFATLETFSANVGTFPRHTVIKDGNLVAGGGSNYTFFATQRVTGKRYFEFTIVAAASGYPIVGVWQGLDGPNRGIGAYPGHSTSMGVGYEANGTKDINGSNSGFGSTFTTNDIIGCAVDEATGKVWFSKNNTWQASGDPVTGANPAATLTGGYYVPGGGVGSGTVSINFGARAFAFTPPSGFVGLSTGELAAPAIKKGSLYFAPRTYVGNAGTKTINDLLFSPNLAWIKARDATTGHRVVDTVRGATKSVATETTAAEVTESTGVVSFDGAGVTLGADADYNANAVNFRAWFWKKGVAPGVDIVTYTGDNTSNRDVSHALGVKPAFIIVKRLDNTSDWWFWHRFMTGDAYFQTLNGTGTQSNTNSPFGTGSVTSSTFRVTNNGTNNANASAGTYVAYLFAEVPGFSDFQKYQGNGSSDGPVIKLNHRPAFVFVRSFGNALDGNIFDRARDPTNPLTNYLGPGVASAENFGVDGEMYVTSNGVKLSVSTASTNTSGADLFIASFAEVPFKYGNSIYC